MKHFLQVEQEHQDQARAELADAWWKVSTAAEDPNLEEDALEELDEKLRDAIGVATEWGVDCEKVVDEVEAAK